ncbi:MAG TPA: hypothetical protein VLZ89_12370 [Anaerolineales bacterium]|nr:hypothetical protein [Anaerolineales bacterium]
MKKIALISALGLMLLGCSLSNLLSPATAPPPAATNTMYVTPSSSATITATLPTPTFTGTPTLIGGGFTDTPTLSAADLTQTPAVTESPADTTSTLIISGISLATPPGVGFTAVRISGNILHWGGCEPSSITFTAHVADPVNETGVLLFLGLKSPTTGEYTGLRAGAIMNGDEAGTFTYTVTVKNITNYQDFPGAWLQYQFVATHEGRRVGWTQVYLNSITISRCQ